MADTFNCAGLVEMLVKALVDDKDSVGVEVVDEEDTLTINVTVAPEEVGKVIGRSGRVIKSIRVLARAVASQEADAPAVEVEVLG